MANEHDQSKLNQLCKKPEFKKMAKFVETTIRHAANKGDRGVFILHDDIFRSSGVKRHIVPFGQAWVDSKWTDPLELFIRGYGFEVETECLLEKWGFSIRW